MTVDKELIRNIPFFASASDELLDTISNHASIKQLPADLQIAYEGMSSEHFFIVLSGEVRVYKMSSEGKEVTLFKVLEDESCILTIFSIINHSHYPAFASTQTEIEALMIPAKAFEQ
jgi:CRP/FNR family transcriptional regulator